MYIIIINIIIDIEIPGVEVRAFTVRSRKLAEA